MKNVDGLLQKGMAALQSGRLRDAERCFRQAVEIAPRHFGALNLLTVALTGLERFDEAETIRRAGAADRRLQRRDPLQLRHGAQAQQQARAGDRGVRCGARHQPAARQGAQQPRRRSFATRTLRRGDRRFRSRARLGPALRRRLLQQGQCARRAQTPRGGVAQLRAGAVVESATCRRLRQSSHPVQRARRIRQGGGMWAPFARARTRLRRRPSQSRRAPRWGGRSARRRCAGSAICWRNRPTISWRSACASGFLFWSISSTRRASTSNGSRRLTPTRCEGGRPEGRGDRHVFVRRGAIRGGNGRPGSRHCMGGPQSGSVAGQAGRHDGDVRPAGRGAGGVRRGVGAQSDFVDRDVRARRAGQVHRRRSDDRRDGGAARAGEGRDLRVSRCGCISRSARPTSISATRRRRSVISTRATA